MERRGGSSVPLTERAVREPLFLYAKTRCRNGTALDGEGIDKGDLYRIISAFAEMLLLGGSRRPLAPFYGFSIIRVCDPWVNPE